MAEAGGGARPTLVVVPFKSVADRPARLHPTARCVCWQVCKALGAAEPDAPTLHPATFS